MQRAAAETRPPLAESSNSEPLTLARRPTQIALQPPAATAPLSHRLQALAPSDQVYLILQGLRVAGPVAGSYEVYLDLPPGAPADPKSAHYVSDFNFFGAESGRRNAVFNVTDQLRALSKTGAISDRPTVTIVAKDNAETAGKPAIGKVFLVPVQP